MKSNGLCKAIQKFYVIKLGGSVITEYENGKPSFKKDDIRRLESEFLSYYKKSKRKFGSVITIGGGEFAHPRAIDYRKGEGSIEDILNAVKEIENKVTGELETVGLDYTVYRPHNFVEAYGLDHYGLEVFNFGEGPTNLGPRMLATLRAGKIPVTFGDVVKVSDIAQRHRIRGKLDKEFSIISADDIFREAGIYLSEKCPNDEIKGIMISDTMVYTEDPKENHDAKPIKTVYAYPENNNLIVKPARGDGLTNGDNGEKITGGMMRKLRKVGFLAAEYGIETQIINGLEEGNFLKALSGKQVGTLVKPRPTKISS